MSIFRNITEALQDAAFIWRQEMRQVVRDEGVLIFFILVPLFYPLLYSWIYTGEVVREVPVVVVDQCHSQLSRQFIRRCDASPDVKILSHANDLDEARSLVSRQVAKGIYLIPSDFEEHINRMEQATVSVYCDMSLMLAYKAVFQTAQTVSMQMGSEIQTRLGQHYTAREEQISARPLDFDEVAIFNPTGGYGSFIIPAVLMLIIQQTLVLGIGLSAGTAREDNRYNMLIPISRHHRGMLRIVFGKAMAYFMIYAVMTAYLVMVVPRLFSFTAIGHWQDLLLFLLPYLLACIFFGMTVSCIIRYRENVMLLIVFVTLPLLFLTGISWPQSSIPGFWQGISWLFPSTFGVRGYVRINEMGATLSDVLPELRFLWLQTAVYFAAACLVYRYQIYLSRRVATERLNQMQQNNNDEPAS
ncbi:MAG: ABC transporter permease [Prevotella sp.]|nr:ABC transporter permease [Prevotella sp.]